MTETPGNKVLLKKMHPTRELKMENEFLKKAAAYFAKDHR